MQVRILVGAESAHACLTGTGWTMNVLLTGNSAPVSLRRSAKELRDAAELSLYRARRMEAAADILEAQNDKGI